jgi:hypothetical protein
MTMCIGLIVIVTLLFASGVILLRGSTLKRFGRWKIIFFSSLIGVSILFLVWLAIMVFVVGPSMRAI